MLPSNHALVWSLWSRTWFSRSLGWNRRWDLRLRLGRGKLLMRSPRLGSRLCSKSTSKLRLQPMTRISHPKNASKFWMARLPLDKRCLDPPLRMSPQCALCVIKSSRVMRETSWWGAVIDHIRPASSSLWETCMRSPPREHPCSPPLWSRLFLRSHSVRGARILIRGRQIT